MKREDLIAAAVKIYGELLPALSAYGFGLSVELFGEQLRLEVRVRDKQWREHVGRYVFDLCELVRRDAVDQGIAHALQYFTGALDELKKELDAESAEE